MCALFIGKVQLSDFHLLLFFCVCAHAHMHVSCKTSSDGGVLNPHNATLGSTFNPFASQSEVHLLVIWPPTLESNTVTSYFPSKVLVERAVPSFCDYMLNVATRGDRWILVYHLPLITLL
jgi:hypothetical protein